MSRHKLVGGRVLCLICNKNGTKSTTGVCRECRYQTNYAKMLGIPVKVVKNVKPSQSSASDKKVEKIKQH